MSAIEIPSVPQGPEPASEPALVIRAEGRAASRWYRQPALMAGIVILAVVVGLALAAPLITSYNPIAQNLNESLLGPSARHWLGTDQLGRDTFTRLLYGLRLDLRIAFLAVLFPFVLGIVLGIAGRVLRRLGGHGHHAARRHRGGVPVLRARHRPGLRARPGRAQHLHRDHGRGLGRLRADHPRRDPGGQAAGLRDRRPGGRAVQPAHHAPAPAAQRDHPGVHLLACPTSSRTSWPS